MQESRGVEQRVKFAIFPDLDKRSRAPRFMASCNRPTFLPSPERVAEKRRVWHEPGPFIFTEKGVAKRLGPEAIYRRALSWNPTSRGSLLLQMARKRLSPRCWRSG